MTPQPNPAGRTRRNLEELNALAKDCGWRPVAYLADSVRYRHPDSLHEELDVPAYRDCVRFDERYDAALARLTPEPSPEPLPSRGLSSQLIRAVSGHNAVIARHMCHWVQGVGAARAELDTHEEFHYGDVCPYEAVATVLSGQPDPRDAAPTVTPPSLAGITSELAEHSANLDHVLDYDETVHWFCKTCSLGESGGAVKDADCFFTYAAPIDPAVRPPAWQRGGEVWNAVHDSLLDSPLARTASIIDVVERTMQRLWPVILLRYSGNGER